MGNSRRRRDCGGKWPKERELRSVIVGLWKELAGGERIVDCRGEEIAEGKSG